MERLWSPAGATSGKHRQIGRPPKPRKQAKSVAALRLVAARVATPSGRAPDETVVAEARRVAAATGGEVLVGDDPVVAVRDASAVFTDVLASMGDETEAADRRRSFAGYQVNETLMRVAAQDAVFIHCLPARRGEEVSADILDGPRSLVWTQVANHLYVTQAVIWALICGESRARRNAGS
jgi:ornithine carbamoyltransferase